MSVLKLKLNTARPTSQLVSTFETATGNHAVANRIVNYITSLQTGTELAMSASVPPSINISIQENETQASGTIVFSAVASTNDTVLINGVTFTAVASGAVASSNQWNIGSTNVLSASGLSSAVNLSVTALVSGYVTASSASGTVTITSAFYGTSGNQCTLAKGVDGGGVMTVSGARLVGGAADPTAQTLSY